MARRRGVGAAAGTSQPSTINRVDAAAKMFGVGSKQHKAAIAKFGPSGGPSAQNVTGMHPQKPTTPSAPRPAARISRVDAAILMHGGGSKEHMAALKKYGPGGGPSVAFNAKHPRDRVGKFRDKG